MTAPRTPLAAAFLASLRRDPGDASAEALEPLLAGAVDRARARWPTARVEPADFVREVAQRLPPEVPAADALATIATDDLWLACGCGRGDPAALRAFEDAFVRDVGAWVSRVDPSPAFADEVRQVLREKLFAGPAPRIREYAGTGALGGWTRVAALRIALNLKRGDDRAPAPGAEPVDDAIGPDLGPELAYLRAQYRGAFADALRAALEALPDRDRALLRLYHVEALSLEAIAALYRVHLSTVSRWLSRAREAVSAATTRLVCERLGVGASQVDSLAALVLSQVDLSIARVLGATR